MKTDFSQMSDSFTELKSNPPRLPRFLEVFDQDGDGRLSELEVAKIFELPPAKQTAIEEESALLLLLEIMAAGKLAKLKLVPTEDINFDEFSILSILLTDATAHKGDSSYQGMLNATLKSEVNLIPSTLSVALNKLVKRSEDGKPAPWIEMQEYPPDRTQKLIAITEHGKAKLKKARKDFMAELRKSLLTLLDLKQILELRDVLFRFNVTLNPKHDPSGAQQQNSDTTEQSSIPPQT